MTESQAIEMLALLTEQAATAARSEMWLRWCFGFLLAMFGWAFLYEMQHGSRWTLGERPTWGKDAD